MESKIQFQKSNTLTMQQGDSPPRTSSVSRGSSPTLRRIWNKRAQRSERSGIGFSDQQENFSLNFNDEE